MKATPAWASLCQPQRRHHLSKTLLCQKRLLSPYLVQPHLHIQEAILLPDWPSLKCLCLLLRSQLLPYIGRLPLALLGYTRMICSCTRRDSLLTPLQFCIGANQQYVVPLLFPHFKCTQLILHLHFLAFRHGSFSSATSRSSISAPTTTQTTDQLSHDLRTNSPCYSFSSHTEND